MEIGERESGPAIAERKREISLTVRAMGPERCLYGTDCPYNFPGEDGSFDYGKTMERVRELGLASAELEAVMGANAERLLLR